MRAAQNVTKSRRAARAMQALDNGWVSGSQAAVDMYLAIPM